MVKINGGLSPIQFQELIQSKINELNLSYSFIEEVVANNSAQRFTPLEIVNYKTNPENFILKLRKLRYSHNTEKKIKVLPIAIGMEDFINFHHTKDLDKLNENDIQSFYDTWLWKKIQLLKFILLINKC